MKYCVRCGKLMEDRGAYCSNCGTPANGACHPTYRPVNPNVIDPDLQYPSPLCKLAAGITGIVYGLGLLSGGILQLGLSLKSHDPSQRANGIRTLAGRLVITFPKEILNLITG